jgi:hypothetical protein
MNIPLLGRLIDERFLEHRRRSTSLAGVIGGVVAASLFGYRYYVNGVWSWDLLAVALTIVGVKLTMLAWYLLTD